MVYAGMVVKEHEPNKYSITEHVKEADYLLRVDANTGKLEEKIPLYGIENATFPGRKVVSAAIKNSIDYLYTGRKLKIFGLSRLRLWLRGIKNEALPEGDISAVINDLHEKYSTKALGELTPAYQ